MTNELTAAQIADKDAASKRVFEFAAAKNGAPKIATIGKLLGHTVVKSGVKMIAEMCENFAKLEDREDHAAQYRVIAKRLRKVLA